MNCDFKVWVVVGTRPEVIKQVPLYRALVKKLGKHEVGLIGTGQHRELLDQALTHFGEKLDVDLKLMQSGQRLGSSAVRVHAQIEELIANSKPEMLIVQGDTTTGAMTAVAGFHNGIQIVHTEAGLRSYDLDNPYPEEANRRWISAVADLHFAPTEIAKQALLSEHINANRIFVVGNTGIDSLMWTLREKPCPPETGKMIAEWRACGLKPILVSAHRRENDMSKMDAWFHGLADFLTKRQDIVLVCPMHPNNRSLDAAKKHLGSHDRARLVPPLDYASICHLLGHCRFIVTDSGGLQEEAATLGIPCVICRKITERPECVSMGIARLADPIDGESIIEAMAWAYNYALNSATASRLTQYPFGDGTAAEKIATILFG